MTALQITLIEMPSLQLFYVTRLKSHCPRTLAIHAEISGTSLAAHLALRVLNHHVYEDNVSFLLCDVPTNRHSLRDASKG